MVQRFAALAYPDSNDPPVQIPEPRLQSDPASVENALATFGLGIENRILAICPGAEFGVAKQWPAEHFAATCKTKIDNGWQVWIFGSENDAEVANEIMQMLAEEQRQHCVSQTRPTRQA